MCKFSGVSNPRKFSSELVIPCPSAKLFHLERFAIYGIIHNLISIKSTMEMYDHVTIYDITCTECTECLVDD